MIDAPLPPELRELWSREQIRSVLYRYVRGVDRRDYDLVRCAYHADAHDDHGGYQGGVDGLLEWIARRHSFIEQSLHLLGQIQIDFLSNDVAVVESYNITLQRYPAEASETIQAWVGDVTLAADERLRTVLYARYVDRFERRDGEWKIARRQVVIEDVGAEVTTARLGAPISAVPERSRSDAIYKLLGGSPD